MQNLIQRVSITPALLFAAVAVLQLFVSSNEILTIWSDHEHARHPAEPNYLFRRFFDVVVYADLVIFMLWYCATRSRPNWLTAIALVVFSILTSKVLWYVAIASAYRLMMTSMTVVLAVLLSGNRSGLLSPTLITTVLVTCLASLLFSVAVTLALRVTLGLRIRSADTLGDLKASALTVFMVVFSIVTIFMWLGANHTLNRTEHYWAGSPLLIALSSGLAIVTLQILLWHNWHKTAPVLGATKWWPPSIAIAGMLISAPPLLWVWPPQGMTTNLGYFTTVTNRDYVHPVLRSLGIIETPSLRVGSYRLNLTYDAKTVHFDERRSDRSHGKVHIRDALVPLQGSVTLQRRDITLSESLRRTEKWGALLRAAEATSGTGPAFARIETGKVKSVLLRHPEYVDVDILFTTHDSTTTWPTIDATLLNFMKSKIKRAE